MLEDCFWLAEIPKSEQKINSYYGNETPGGEALHGTLKEETLKNSPREGAPQETPGGGGPVPRQ